MLKIFSLVTLLICLCEQIMGQSNSNSFHARFDSLLEINVHKNKGVNYTNIKNNPRQLLQYLEKIRNFSPTSHPGLFKTPQHSLAYWINAYNATVIAFVVKHYPIKSLLDVDPLEIVFEKETYRFGKESLSLNDIQKSKLLNTFKDPRIHFSLNCASMSCPPIENSAYTYFNVEKKLKAAEMRFAKNQDQLFLKNDTLYVNKILKWYVTDFKEYYPPQRPYESTQHYAVNYFRSFVDELNYGIQLKKIITVKFLQYNWTLNDSKLYK